MFRLATKGARFIISPAGIIEMLFRSPAVRLLLTSSLSMSTLSFYFLLASGSEGCLLVEPSDQVSDISSFLSRCISRPKSALSLGSSFDKSLDMKSGVSQVSWTGHPLSSKSCASTDIEVA